MSSPIYEFTRDSKDGWTWPVVIRSPEVLVERGMKAFEAGYQFTITAFEEGQSVTYSTNNDPENVAESIRAVFGGGDN